MALGLSQVVWREAVVAEIWALSVLLFTATLCLLLRWLCRPEQRRFLCGAFYVFGLLLTGNQELLVMIPSLLLLVLLGDQALGRDLALPITLLALIGWVLSAFDLSPWFGAYTRDNIGLLAAFLLVAAAAAVAIVRTRRFASEWKAAAGCGVMLLLGLACYLYLPVASMTNPPGNWGYARTVEGFFHTVTRGQYEPYHPTDELVRFIGQLWIVTKETAKGFGWFYLLFAMLPFGLLRQTNKCARALLLGLATVFVCVGPLMVALLNPSADLGIVTYLRPYFAPMYVVLAIWTGLGLMVFGSTVAKRPFPPRLGATPA